MLDLGRYKGIIFDMDGTLIDSMGSHIEAWEQTCLHYGYPFDEAYMHGLGGVPTQKTAEILNQKFGLNHDPRDVAVYKRLVWESMDHTPTLIDETYQLFCHYRPSKQIAIGTGAERPHAEHLLQHHDLLDKLDALVTATDVTHGKPHPETFVTAAQEMGLQPSECIVFEDTEIGFQAAQSAGMDCILVRNGRIQK
ncbi:beta-phosphoglucomutase family hydrolase [Alteromonas aestuariivivens]|uniref:Beta-phosphoglucomutase family hydrolase n=1 Tax=Alteromonas aestuariivivens TaxID=1938339 RepID=A0A3D8M6Z1_9ALTE|nr:beta-phosphoglucomutase family hydrolase [Alteromonas aestuariivivens]RDV25546.1 beta-phosphoglucomutase family hydrolase [Alteromonas aestuariivivens]